MQGVAAPAHEEGEQGRGGHGDDGCEGEGVVVPGQFPEGGGRAAGGAGIQEVAHHPVGHPAAGGGFGHHAGAERQGADAGPRQAGAQGQAGGGQGHGDQAQHGAVGHPAGLARAHQQALVEAPVADGRGPGGQHRRGQVGQVHHVGGQPQHPLRQQAEHRRQGHDHQDRRQRAVEQVGEAPQGQEARPVPAQGGGGGKQHDDGRFHQPGQGEGEAEGRQVLHGPVHARHDGRQVGALGAHHEPGGRKRQPEGEDRPDAQRGVHASRVVGPPARVESRPAAHGVPPPSGCSRRAAAMAVPTLRRAAPA